MNTYTIIQFSEKKGRDGEKISQIGRRSEGGVEWEAQVSAEKPRSSGEPRVDVVSQFRFHQTSIDTLYYYYYLEHNHLMISLMNGLPTFGIKLNTIIVQFRCFTSCNYVRSFCNKCQGIYLATVQLSLLLPDFRVDSLRIYI